MRIMTDIQSPCKTEDFRVIIAGSREFNDYEFLKEKCLFFLSSKLKDPKYKVIIVSGNARGADSLGERFAKEQNLPLELFPANWDKYGKSAGYRRNKDMALVSNALIAFKLETAENKGTNNMIEIAQKEHLKVRVIKYGEN